jgi:hypothetical protein
MANALITPTIIAQEALFQLENNLQMANQVHREYREEFVKVGQSVNIRKPVKFVTSDGATLVKQDVEEANTSITVSSQKHVGWEFSSIDLTMTIEEYSERYITPAMITLAQTVDKEGLALYDQVWSSVSNGSFVKPDTFAEFALLGIRMDEMAIPPSGSNNRDRRRFIGKSNTTHSMAGGQAALLQERLVAEAWTRGRVNIVDDIDIYMDQNVATHTVGVATGSPTVDGAAQDVTYAASKTTNSQSLVTQAWTNSITDILKAGDVITLAGVNAVNPIPGEGVKQDLGYLQQFTVLADADSGATTGPATLTISPAIIVSGPYQTVTAAPADDAAIVVLGATITSYAQHLGFHRNAFALVTVPLIMPLGAVFKARATHKGLSIRVIRAYDITTDTEAIRLDILYGWKAIYPDLAVRYWTTV